MPCNVSVRGAFQLTLSVGRATATAKGVTKVINISIHALREESDEKAGPCHRASVYFNPRPPRGGRQLRHKGGLGLIEISIHALREEGDARRSTKRRVLKDFNPRPPRGGRRRLFAVCA